MACTTAYLIAYDIRDPKRLRWVERHLSKLARRVQYSVFTADLTPAALEDQCQALSRLIDARVDDLRVYPVPQGAGIKTSGPPATGEGVIVVGDGTGRLCWSNGDAASPRHSGRCLESKHSRFRTSVRSLLVGSNPRIAVLLP